MATVSRRAGSGRATFNQGQQRTDTITYTVQGIEVRALKYLIGNGQQGTIGLPSYGDLHPELPPDLGMRARAFAVSEESTGEVADVSVTYTTSNVNGTGLLYAVPDISGSQFTWGATFETVEVMIPVAYRVFEVVSDGQTEQELPRWTVEPEPVLESRMIINARWQIGGGTFDSTMRLAFEGEHDRIHTINGEQYLFKLESITPRDNLTYEVTGSWTRDKGTPRPSKDSGDTDRVRQPHELQYLDNLRLIYPFRAPTDPPPDGIIRPPFHHLRTIPSPFPLADDPDISAPWVVVIRNKNLGNVGNLPLVPFT